MLVAAHLQVLRIAGFFTPHLEVGFPGEVLIAYQVGTSGFTVFQCALHRLGKGRGGNVVGAPFRGKHRYALHQAFGIEIVVVQVRDLQTRQMAEYKRCIQAAHRETVIAHGADGIVSQLARTHIGAGGDFFRCHLRVERADVGHTLDTGSLGSGEEARNALRVVARVEVLLGHRTVLRYLPNVHTGCEHQPVEPFQAAIGYVIFNIVRGNERQLCQCRHLGGGTRHDRHLMPCLRQMQCSMAANQPGSAYHQYSHVVLLNCQ